MEIDKLLRLHKWTDNDEEMLGMIISNRIDFYDPRSERAMVSSKQWKELSQDIIKFFEFKSQQKGQKT